MAATLSIVSLVLLVGVLFSQPMASSDLASILSILTTGAANTPLVSAMVPCTSGQLGCDGLWTRACRNGQWANGNYCATGCINGYCQGGQTAPPPAPQPVPPSPAPILPPRALDNSTNCTSWVRSSNPDYFGSYTQNDSQGRIRQCALYGYLERCAIKGMENISQWLDFTKCSVWSDYAGCDNWSKWQPFSATTGNFTVNETDAQWRTRTCRVLAYERYCESINPTNWSIMEYNFTKTCGPWSGGNCTNWSAWNLTNSFNFSETNSTTNATRNCTDSNYTRVCLTNSSQFQSASNRSCTDWSAGCIEGARRCTGSRRYEVCKNNSWSAGLCPLYQACLNGRCVDETYPANFTSNFSWVNNTNQSLNLTCQYWQTLWQVNYTTTEYNGTMQRNCTNISTRYYCIEPFNASNTRDDPVKRLCDPWRPKAGLIGTGGSGGLASGAAPSDFVSGLLQSISCTVQGGLSFLTGAPPPGGC